MGESIVDGMDQLEKIQEQIANGDNVVLFANHQSEADPQIFSVLLDDKVPGFAESTIFVAGDRVTPDLFATPFSMGRNLLCIYSKKHVDNPPELKSQKQNHFYPLSMFTYPICPPPQHVGGEVGERRTVKFAPAALHFGEEVDLKSARDPDASKDEQREA